MTLFSFFVTVLSFIEFYTGLLIINLFIPLYDRKGWFKLGCSIVAVMIIAGHPFISSIDLTNEILIVSFFIICYLFGDASIVKNISVVFLVILCILLTDVCVFSLISFFEYDLHFVVSSDSSYVLLIASMLSRSIFVLIYLLLRDFMKKNHHIESFVWKWVLLIAVLSTIVIFVVLEGVVSEVFDGYFAYLIVIVFVIINWLVIHLCLRISQVTYENIEHKVFLETFRYEEEISMVIKDKALELSKIKHDFINHIIAIRAMIQENDPCAANAYLDAISIDMGSVVYVTENRVLNAQLARLEAKAKAYNIDVHSIIVGNYFDYIDDVDMTILVGNLLDNAVEATLNCEKKSLRLHFDFQNKNMAKFSIRNSSNPVKIGRDGRIKTSKKDKINHGYGINNIKTVIKTYDGVLTSSYGDQIFGQLCILHRPCDQVVE